MESNLDDKYYQKYIQYKNKYLMLKQLKYNNDLEGGSFMNWFGSNEKKKADTKTTVAKATDAKAIDAATETDGVYLVFNIDKIVPDDHVYAIYQNKETNKVGKNNFNLRNNDKAYIITKKGDKFLGKIITNEKNIDSLLTNIKENLYLDTVKHPDLNSCIQNYNKYSEYVDNILNEKNISNKDIISELNKIRLDFLKRSTEMKNKLNSDNDELSKLFTKILLMPEYLKYKTFNFDYTLSFTSVNNSNFLEKLITVIERDNKNKVKLNMIIKIKETDESYVFEDRDDKSISNTLKYREIIEHKIAFDKTKEQTPAAESTSAPTSEPTTESPPPETSDAK
jgi:hypothetical protein